MTTYGPGGFDPNHPNGNVVEETVDNGDGTATTTTYDANGVQTGTSTGPIPPVHVAVQSEQTIRSSFDQAMNRLALIADAPSFTAAQRDQAIRDLARILRRTIRLVDNRLDASD